MAPPNRTGGGGLSLRTLTLASLASATAAIVTSRLFPPGTVFTAALTPVIVAIVNEMVARPVDRVTALREQRRTMVLEAREARVARALGEETSPLAGAPEFSRGEAADEELATAVSANGHGRGDGVAYPARTYGRAPWWRKIHPRVAIATGLIAFVVAAAALTLPELIFGGAVATGHKTTYFGGGSPKKTKTTEQKATTGATTTPETTTTTAPAQTPADTQTTETQADTQTTDTTTTDGGVPAPTGTSTAPAPGGTPPPSG